MVELRWVRRVVGKHYDQYDKIAVNDETQNVLQVRYQYDATVYAGMGPRDYSQRNMVWTDWRDVPVVPEIK